ncbi:MAG: RNase adapter RapZ [Armatimonadetes bacterium]|nr:RNase adapter RapZ [Armatimonadota bacterium]
MQFVIITGLSGAGKTLASHQFEDLGFFCVDNLPSALIPTFAELCQRSKGEIDRVVLVSDVRGGEFFPELFDALATLQVMGARYRILFLDADDQALVTRFKETRRRHPLADELGDLLECIRAEREELWEIRERADKIIDTTDATPRELREEILRFFLDTDELNEMIIKVISFGFKYGIPHDADLVFDVRFLVNPNYVKDLGHLNGTDRGVIQYVLKEPDSLEYLKRLYDLMDFSVPRYLEEGKAYLTIGVGCTGGRHRSVVIANELYTHLQQQNLRCLIQHRDIIRKGERLLQRTEEPVEELALL